jgi:hypothetical protein
MAILKYPSRRWRCTRGAVFGLLLLFLHPGAAGPLDEYDVKAAFLFNFAKFIEWPESAMNSEKVRFTLGVLGADPFGGALLEVARGKTLNGRAVEVRQGRTVSELAGCDVVFLAASEEKRIERHLEALGGTPALTVSDTAGFARRGGMIELYLDGNRIRFAINLKAMREAGLEPSSKLLALARIVDG